METIPPEIAGMIFALACTDGGATGCSLSLVSRQVRAFSSAVHLQSVAVPDVRRMRALLAALEARPPPLRHVRYLYVASPPLPSDPWRDVDEELALFAKARALCDRILALAAPHLVVLTATLMGLPYKLPGALRFPLLADLALDSVFTHTAARELPLLHPDAFPAARRVHLHYVNMEETDRWPALFAHVADAAPRIAVLRLSGLTARSKLAEFLLDAVVAPNGAAQECLPAGLRRLLVQHRPQQGRVCGTGRSMYRLRIREFDSTLGGGSSRLRIETLGIASYGLDIALRDWLDASEGGEGCWRVEKSAKL